MKKCISQKAKTTVQFIIINKTSPLFISILLLPFV